MSGSAKEVPKLERGPDERVSSEVCSMQRLVEADHDARLGEREHASVLRHVTTCSECRDHAASLRELRKLATLPAEPVTSLDHHRGRVRLLKDAALPPTVSEDDFSQPTEARRGAGASKRSFDTEASVFNWLGPRHPARRFALGAGLFALALATVGVGERALFHKEKVTLLAGSVHPSVSRLNLTVVGADPGTELTRSHDGGLELVTLARGTVHVRVHHLHTGERFIVRTGDAEVEVRGTRFDVEARDGALVRVAVAEGVVELRRRGETRLLTAGSSWNAPSEVEPVATASLPRGRAQTLPLHNESAHARSAPSAANGRATKLGSTEPEVKRSAPGAGSNPTVTDAPADETEGFKNGMARLEKGDFGQAASDLGRFAAAHPDDPRAEDAAFLEALSLSRAGRLDDAATAARSYLARFPNGYRRAEAEKLLQKH